MPAKSKRNNLWRKCYLKYQPSSNTTSDIQSEITGHTSRQDWMTRTQEKKKKGEIRKKFKGAIY